MPTDLYSFYKLIAQRSRRDPDSFEKWEMKQLAHDLVKRQPGRDEMLVITGKMLEIEQRIAGRGSLFSLHMKDAIEANDYFVDVPYVKRHAWNEAEDAKGYVYIATAQSRPGLSKLGATYYAPQERLDKYTYRYGYRVCEFWSAYVRLPFNLETEISRKHSHLRFAGLTYADSNEWYQMTPEALKAAIEKKLEAW